MEPSSGFDWGLELGREEAGLEFLDSLELHTWQATPPCLDAARPASRVGASQERPASTLSPTWPVPSQSSTSQQKHVLPTESEQQDVVPPEIAQLPQAEWQLVPTWEPLESRAEQVPVSCPGQLQEPLHVPQHEPPALVQLQQVPLKAHAHAGPALLRHPAGLPAAMAGAFPSNPLQQACPELPPGDSLGALVPAAHPEQAADEAKERSELLLRYWHLVQRRQQLLAAEAANAPGARAVSNGFRSVRFAAVGFPAMSSPWSSPAPTLPRAGSNSAEGGGQAQKRLPPRKRGWSEMQPHPAPTSFLQLSPPGPPYGMEPSTPQASLLPLPPGPQLSEPPSTCWAVPTAFVNGDGQAKRQRAGPDQQPAMDERQQDHILSLAREAYKLRQEVNRLQRILSLWARQGFVTPGQALEFLGSMPV